MRSLFFGAALMMARLLLLLLPSAAAADAAAFDVAVTVGIAHAATVVTSLTSVTMDVCLCKQNFPFGDPTLLALTSHLGGGASILRVGGSDQNDFYYDVNSTKTSPYSAKSGERCCKSPGSCHGCAKDCTLPAPYWKSISDFAKASGHKLMFGLVPKTDEATALITHSAKEGLPVVAYTFGNEVDSDAVTKGYPVLRKLLSDTSIFPAGTAPKLAGPDVALQRHAAIDDALAGGDSNVVKKLEFVESFAASIGTTLDVISWHTYDFETRDIGMTDHTTLSVHPETARLWSTKYLDFALRLAGNMTAIRNRVAPQADVWLSESDSICHQGVMGVTNAYLNSVWLVNRLGIMANANVTVMARQSLVGYNYSLLGNWPVEPIKPNPDFYTTVLFRRLFGDTVLATTATPSAPGPAPTNATGGGDRVRAFAFCASGGGGAIAVSMVNFDPDAAATFKFDKALGAHREYLLAPGADPVVASAAWSSREMLLNGELLKIGPGGALPRGLMGGGKGGEGSVVLQPLHVGFAVFPDAGVADCKK